MTRRRARNKNNLQNGSDMANSSEVSPPTSVPSSPEGNHDPSHEVCDKQTVFGDEKVVEITEKTEKKNDRLPLVLWRNPITVIHYSSCELVLSLLEGAQALLKYKASLTITCVTLSKSLGG